MSSQNKSNQHRVVKFKRSDTFKSIEKSIDNWWVNYAVASNTLSIIGLAISCCTPEWTIILVQQGVEKVKYSLAPFTSSRTTEFESGFESVKKSEWYLSWCENPMLNDQGCLGAELSQKSLLLSGILLCLILLLTLIISFTLNRRGTVPSFTFVRFASALSFFASVIGFFGTGSWHRIVEKQLVAAEENVQYVRSGWALSLAIVSSCLAFSSFLTLWLSMNKKVVITLTDQKEEESDDEEDEETKEVDGIEINHIGKSLN
jgi:hypothetical protein